MVVRTADDTHIAALKQAGAAEVVAEVTEGSVMLASQALLLSGVPLSRVIRQHTGDARQTLQHVQRLLPHCAGAGRCARERTPRTSSRVSRTCCSMPTDIAVGKQLVEMKLDQLSVEVNAVRRHNVEGSQPAGDMVLRAGDVLVLLGQPVTLEAAEKRLRKG